MPWRVSFIIGRGAVRKLLPLSELLGSMPALFISQRLTLLTESLLAGARLQAAFMFGC
jgi:hypothetical protein